MRVVLDYNLPYHVLQEEEDYIYQSKLSFNSLEDAKEFIKFAPNPNLLIVQTEDLKNYFLATE